VSAAVERREASGLCAKARCRVRRRGHGWMRLSALRLPSFFGEANGNGFRGLAWHSSGAKPRRENGFSISSLPGIAVRKNGVASLAYAGNLCGGFACSTVCEYDASAWTTGVKPGGDETEEGAAR
jgi:hypothetical protein